MTKLLENSLKAITRRVNLSTGLANPDDMNPTKDLFVKLHDNGEILLANEITLWAEQKGWKPKDAEELGALAQQIGMGKRVPIKEKGNWWKKEILSILEKGE
ncbi:MAG: hypothetical protein RAO94_04130 [Candidatus Stygibacter australis]|nr:hypothetical protein [Candidatus Stygibacter australis]